MESDGKTFEIFCQVILKKQFVASCLVELSAFLQRKPTSALSEIVRLGKSYIQIHV